MCRRARRPSADRGLSVWASTQSVFGVRREIANMLGLDADAVVVRAPAVGGGFGAKGGMYVEQLMVAALAARLGRAVAWVETRNENLLNMTHGRGQVHDVEVGARRDGTIVGLAVRAVADVGAYPIRGAFIPMVTRFMASGVYRIPEIEFDASVALTNTTPTGPYRGAGRPEAAALAERTMDVLARVLDVDPAEMRRRNFIRPEAFPYRTPIGAVYDTGDYDRALDEALPSPSTTAGGPSRRAPRRDDRRQLGIGIGCYVEVSGRGGEYGSVSIGDDGCATVVTGSVPHGQGHETTWAQIASSVLGVPFETCRSCTPTPRSCRTASGRSGRGRRSSPGARARCCGRGPRASPSGRRVDARGVRRRRGRVRRRTARRGGRARVGRDVGAIGEAASRDSDVRRSRAIDFDSEGSFPFGCHVAVVEIDPETGGVDLLHHTAVDDCGRVVNPLLAEAQVHGGIAQGVAQMLFEAVALRRRRQPADRDPARLRRAERRGAAVVRGPPHRDADAEQPARREGHRRVRDDRLDRRGVERGGRRARAVRRAAPRHAVHARARLACDTRRRRGSGRGRTRG